MIALAAALWPCPALAQKRLALVIGINGYTEVPRLLKAVNDGRTMGTVLRNLGFEVHEGFDLRQREMARAIETIRSRVEPGDTVFFFFAGHGVEIKRENYLLPADVPAAEEGQDGLVRDAAFSAGNIVDRFQERGAKLVISVLDACRDNPFERPGGRSLNLGRGLAPMERAEGTFTLFSAGAKQMARDSLGHNDPDPNSVFTRIFAARLQQPDLSIVDLAKIVQRDVRDLAATVRHQQNPAYYDGVIGHIYLAQSGQASPTPRAAPPSPGPQVAAVDPLPPRTATAPETARDASLGGARAFLFPDSDRRHLSRNELQRLSTAELRIARNEIYARRGRFFRDSALDAHFRRLPWYRPHTWDVPLNPIERANVNLIQSMER
jgi:hypothetical protein